MLGLKHKGHLGPGADADITVFNPASVKDEADFQKGLQFSTGIDDVLVNGVPVVANGKTVPNAFPGQPITGNFSPAR